MAVKKKSVVNMTLLAALNDGSVSRVSQEDGLPLVNHDPPLIGVNLQDVIDRKAVAWLTDAGRALLPNGHDAKSELSHSDTPKYAIITGFTFEAQHKKRGRAGGGAPTIYPWATMDVGASFFVGVSEKDDPVKSMTSAVSSANMKYSEEYGEPEQVERTKRGKGNKAEVDANGNPIKELVWRRKRKSLRKFELRAVTRGEVLGGWTAPEDGALVGRVL